MKTDSQQTCMAKALVTHNIHEYIVEYNVHIEG